MNTQTNKHIPVMINQAVNFLPQKENLNIIDATFGGGGYSKLLLMNKNINNLKENPFSSLNELNL